MRVFPGPILDLLRRHQSQRTVSRNVGVSINGRVISVGDGTRVRTKYVTNVTSASTMARWTAGPLSRRTRAG